MIDDRLRLSMLYDYYGNLLSDKQRDAIRWYYEEDLSMSEIAILQNISKQGVSDLIIRSEQRLKDIEAELRMYEKTTMLKEVIMNVINELSRSLDKSEEELKNMVSTAVENLTALHDEL